MQLSIRVQGTLVRNGLQNLDAEIPKVSRLVIYRSSQRIIQRMKGYPSRSGSKYNRTFRFRDNWLITAREDGYQVQNRTPYGRYVVGSAFGGGQAWMHVGIWTPLRDVAEEEVKNLPQDISKEIIMVARRNGLTQ